MNQHAKGFRRQFTVNIAANAAYFLVNIVVGLFIVPYYIRHLGVGAYGLIPLASSLTAYLGLVTVALNETVSRYLVIDIHKNDVASANRVFNTAFFLVTTVALVFIPFIGIFSWYAPLIFNLPENIEGGVRLLFFLSMTSFIIGVITGSFSVSTYALNRLDLRNLINIAAVLSRVLPVLLFFAWFGAEVRWVGVALMAGALITLGLNVLAWRKLTPFLRVNIKDFDLTKLRDISHMGKWITVDQVGSLIFLNTDIILVNLLFGPDSAGKYGAVMQWPILLRAMAWVFAGVFSPMLLILFARGDRERMLSLCKDAIKFLGLAMALPIGLICGFGGSVLKLWLGPEFSQYSILLAIMCAPLGVGLAILPLFTIQTTANRVKVPALTTLAGGLLMLALALVLGKFTPLGVYGVAFASAFMFALRNVGFTTVYGASILGVAKTSFLRPLAGGAVGTILVWAVSGLVDRTIMPGSWAALIGCSVAISLLYCAVIYFKAITVDEKKLIASVLRRKMA